MTKDTFKEIPWAYELPRALYVDSGVDWVGDVLRARLLADRDTRFLRQRAYTRAQLRALNNTRLQRQARTR